MPESTGTQESRPSPTAVRQPHVGPARLLPWPGPDGGPSYLVPANDSGPLAQLADEMEAAQLSTGATVLGHARQLIGDSGVTAAELRFAALRLAECLSDALRVAASRGARLGGGD